MIRGRLFAYDVLQSPPAHGAPMDAVEVVLEDRPKRVVGRRLVGGRVVVRVTVNEEGRLELYSPEGLLDVRAGAANVLTVGVIR